MSDKYTMIIGGHRGLVGTLKDTEDAEEQLGLVRQIGDRLSELGSLREDIEMVEAEIYYNIKTLWDSKHIQQGVKDTWDGDFYRWANEYALKGRGEVSPVTINNKVRVFKLWKSPEKTITPPPQVYLPIEGSPEHIELEFDINQVPYSKLLVATGAANRGDMSEAAWLDLMNPSATVQDLKKDLYRAREQVNSGEVESVVFNGDGILYYRTGDMTVAFCQLLYENEENPLFGVAANRLLQMFGLNSDDQLRVDLPEGNVNFIKPLFEGGKVSGVQLAHKGRVFADFSIEEMEDLMEQYQTIKGGLNDRKN